MCRASASRRSDAARLAAGKRPQAAVYRIAGNDPAADGERDAVLAGVLLNPRMTIHFVDDHELTGEFRGVIVHSLNSRDSRGEFMALWHRANAKNGITARRQRS
jgi:hypothetical protein